MPGFTDTQAWGRPNLGLFAHEAGHYLGLAHTFRTEFTSLEQAEAYFAQLNNDPAIFDGDGLSDTPPDPGLHFDEVAASSTASVVLNGVEFLLPRDNIMSYYAHPWKTLSPQQMKRVRRVLEIHPHRKTLYR
jgi:hypothetical protein